MSNHTPGPWVVVDNDDELAIMTEQDCVFCSGDPDLDDEYQLATINCSGCNKEWSDNARLMAAAPELLAACKAAFKSGFLSQKEMNQMRDAIKKAEGE